jgi:hypothetical protein
VGAALAPFSDTAFSTMIASFSNLLYYYNDIIMSTLLRQATLSFHSSGRIDANRPGPRPKAPTKLSTAASTLIYGAGNRRRARGINEIDLVQSLENSRTHAIVGEPDSDDSEAKSDSDHQPRPKARRNAYSREKKLAIITYLELIDMPNPKAKANPNAPWIPVTWSYMSQKLKLDRKCL